MNLLHERNTPILDLLDWPELINRLLPRMHFDQSKEQARSWPVFQSTDELISNFISMDQYISSKPSYDQVISEEYSFIDGSVDFRVLIKKMIRGQIFDFDELNVLANLYASYKQLSKAFKQFNEVNLHQVEPAKISYLDNQFIRPFRTFVQRNGEIDFEKHPLLLEVYRKLKQIEAELREEMLKIVKHHPFKDALQYPEHDIINDRFVLAVRSDSYKSQMGPIIARSNSGMTLMVEPASVREKDQIRIQYLVELDEIKNRICREFSSLLHSCDETYIHVEQFILKMDSLKARSSFSYEYDLIRPSFSDRFEINIKHFWHPLIKNPVKNSIELKSNDQGLIISGPNTGGKTVALKSVAVCYLFLYSGLFIPAHEATLYPIKELYYFGSDGQNLSDGLSSFAYEAKNYLSLLKNIQDDALILIDEIFNSTSSEEASALAISLMDKLKEKARCKVILSTHHQFLKTYMHDNHLYLSAHVDYDHDMNRPTYKLIYGQPGSSLAFKIFDQMSASLSMHEDLTSKAKSVYDKKQYLYEKLLSELSKSKSEYQKLLVEQRQLNHELKNQKNSMEGILTLERKKTLEGYQKKLDKLLKEARDLIADIKEEKIQDKKKVYSIAHHLKSEISREKELVTPSQETELHYHDEILSIKDLQINKKYYSLTLKKNAQVISINERKNEVTVMVLKKSIILKSDDLRCLKYHEPKPENKVQVNVYHDENKSMEIDCRGMRLEEFETIVEQHLSGLFSGEIPFVNIIHGHGDGILKKWLRDRVDSDAALIRSNNEGNDGHTEIKLR